MKKGVERWAHTPVFLKRQQGDESADQATFSTS